MGNYQDIIVILVIVVIALAAGMYYLNRRASVKMTEQRELIDKNKMVQTIFVIDKRKDNIKNVNLPKAVVDQLPRLIKLKKNYFVQAKLGPQIMTFMCDKKVFNALAVKKNAKVELVGIYIMGIASANQKNEDLVKMAYQTSPKASKKSFNKQMHR